MIEVDGIARGLYLVVGERRIDHDDEKPSKLAVFNKLLILAVQN